MDNMKAESIVIFTDLLLCEVNILGSFAVDIVEE
jgi:hypothetical protein